MLSVSVMSSPTVSLKQRTCRSLAGQCLNVIEKSLLQAFYLMSKEKAHPRGVLGTNPVATFLFERERELPVSEVQSYIMSKLPVRNQQELLDNLLLASVTPEFDENSILAKMEFNFSALNTVVRTSDMTEIMENLLKCMLLGFVTKLDFSSLYASESCWVARARRILHTWSTVNGGEEYVKGIETGKINTDCVESFWQDMIYDHGKSLSKGAVNSAKCFKYLTNINVDFVATGELLWAIGCNCPLLQELSLYLYTINRSRYSTHFEEELLGGLSALHGHKKLIPSSFRGKPVGCPKLERIVMPSITMQGQLEKCAGRLLCYLLHLKEVINVGTTGAIAALVKEKEFKRKPLGLLFIDDGRTQDSLEDVCQYYDLDIKRFLPKVDNVRLKVSKTKSEMMMLNNFPKLTKLEIFTLQESELDLKCNLTGLTHFKSNCQWDEKKLAMFSQKTPQLEVFFFLTGSLSKCKNKKKDVLSFPNLRLLKFYHMSHIDSEPVINFLKSTKVLTHIFIEEYEKQESRNSHSLLETINDKVIATVAPALKRLIFFHVRLKKFTGRCKFAMTEKSLHCLLNNCPDLLDVGNIFHWDIAYHDAMAIKKEAREKNWNVNIFPFDDI